MRTLAMLAMFLSFPVFAAEVIPGYGSGTSGGAGFPTVRLTTLEDLPSDKRCDDGDCTFRDALDVCRAQGGINVDLIGGTLALRGPNVIWDCDNATISGERAFPAGVQVVGLASPGFGSTMIVSVASNVIWGREIRWRCTGYSLDPNAPGCLSPNRKVIVLLSGSRVAFIGNSVSWFTDGLIDVGDGKAPLTDATIAWNLLAEGFGAGAMLAAKGATRITYLQNLSVHNPGRNPAASMLAPAFGISEQRIESIENVVFDAYYGFEAQPGLGVTADIVVRGGVWEAVRKVPIMFRMSSKGRASLYAERQWRSGERVPPYDLATLEAQNLAGTWADSGAACTPPCTARSKQAIVTVPLTFRSEAENKLAVLATAGASRICRDAFDRRMVADVLEGRTRPLPVKGPSGPLPTLEACP